MADWSQFNPWGAPDFPSNAAFGTGAPAEDAQRQPNILDKLLASFSNSVATLPERAIGAADTYSKTGEYNPAPIVEAAMLPMGTGAVAGVPVKAGEAVMGAGPIRAYHGSPHDFDQFDLSKIGTGEGAQAYGHGLYFADAEATAKSYRDALQGKGFKIPDDVAALPDEPRRAILQAANAHGAHPDPMQAAKRAQWASPDLRSQPLESIADQISRSRPPPGKMYEVNINADPSHFLDWDKPIAQQSDAVKSALKSAGWDVNRMTAHSGSDLASNRGLYPNGSQQAADALGSNGIPGIKYLDQGSRGNVVPASSQHIYKPWGGPLDVPKPSSNYVVFNDKLIDILRKFGLAGLAPPLFANATANEPKS